MLTVACCLWGDWPGAEDYLRALRNGLSRYLTGEYRFVALTDKPILLSNMETLQLGCGDFPRNLRKMAFYKPNNGLSGRVLALDLDTVVTGDLSDIASYSGRFAVLEDFYDTGQCGGGVISFDAGDKELTELLYTPVARDRNMAGKNSAGGAERHWFRRQFAKSSIKPDFWQSLLPGQLVTAIPIRKPKRIVIDAVPDNARLVSFHGRDKPHNNLHRSWVAEHWRPYG